MKKRYIGLIILGVLLLMAGMGLYKYQVISGEGSGLFFISYISYPYQTLGLVVLGFGLAFVGLGLALVGLDFLCLKRERLHKIFVPMRILTLCSKVLNLLPSVPK